MGQTAGLTPRSYALALVDNHRNEQDEKFGDESNSPERWLTILAEEFGEVGRAILENRPVQLEEELVHVAAVAVAWIEDLQK